MRSRMSKYVCRIAAGIIKHHAAQFTAFIDALLGAGYVDLES